MTLKKENSIAKPTSIKVNANSMTVNHNIKLLFLGSGPAMPSRNLAYTKKFEVLSQYFSGDIITHASSEDMELTNIAGFNFFPFHYKKYNPIIRVLSFYIKAIRKSIAIIRSHSPAETVIISPDPLVTGVAALIIGRITGKKVIIEVNGCFEEAVPHYISNGKGLSFGERIKKKISDIVVPLVLQRAHTIKKLYPEQLDTFKIKFSKNVQSFNFHDFVPVNSFARSFASDGKYILLVGHPWYLKGVDILIKAFQKIRHQFPHHTVKIIGWCPNNKEKQFFQKLVDDNNTFEFCDPVPYKEIITVMEKCSLYVLASRTEAMGRVLIEAMACAKPIIASRVGGVPHIVKDWQNGLLFSSEDVDGLSDKIACVLSDGKLAHSLAMTGYHLSKNELSETQYGKLFEEMVLKTMNTHD